MYADVKALAAHLEIEEYPDALSGIYEEIRRGDPLSGIADTLAQLHAKYDPFDEYYDLLLRGAEALQHNEALHWWLTLGFAYCQDADEKEAAAFPLPPRDGSLEKDAFPAILISMEFPKTIERYRARGFEEVQIKKNLGTLGRSLRVHKITQGCVTLSQGLYHWVTHYTKARIFDHAGFNFQLSKWNDEAILLKNRTSGALAFLMLKGSFTSLGTVVGIRGKEDIPMLFEAVLEETDDAFIGYRSSGQRVLTEREIFNKRDWDVILRPNDDFINFHIPRGADFTPTHVENSIKEGKELIQRYYPECTPTQTLCTSWMLDPKLLDVLPAESKIAQFIRHFVLYPSGDTAGNACMSYVWPGEKCPIEELSERTSLQRGIKKMMLNGDFIFWTTGVWKE